MPERVGATRSFRYLAAVLLLLLFGAGCAPDPGSVAAQANAGDRKGYVSGDGAVETIPEADRAEPIELKGALLDGTAWDSASAHGEVLVLNVWGSCPGAVHRHRLP